MKIIRFLTLIALVAASSVTTTVRAGDLMSVLHQNRRGAGNFWFNAEYLNWRTTGSQLPPLVTGNPLGTPAVEAGVIGADSTNVLFGNDKVFDDARSGYRLGGGMWLTCNLGIEADYFQLSDESFSAQYDATSGQIIGRPFINLSPLPPNTDPRWDTQLIVFPNILTGLVRVSGASEFYGYGTRLKLNLCSDCNNDACCIDDCDGSCDGGCDSDCCTPQRSKSRWFNVTLGHRHLSLKEYIWIHEELFSANDQFEVDDYFRTNSSFDGLEIGFDWQAQCGKFCFDAYSRVAAGINNNDIQIAGQTIDNVAGPFITREGGILAQESNIGNYDCNVGSLVAQLGFSGSMCLTKCISANVGYSMLYWGNVARAGDQIDVRVHPGLFPPPTAPVGTIGALPTNKLTDLVAHGLTVGLTAVY